MPSYDVVLYLHLLTVVAALFTAGMILSSTLRMRAATTAHEAHAAAASTAAAEKIMPVAVLLLLLTGGYMTQRHWSWNTPWIDVSIVGLLLIAGVGAGLLGSRVRAIESALRDASGTSLDADLLARLRDPALLIGNGVIAGLAAGVMFAMTLKPSLGAAIAAVVIGAAAGALATAPATRERRSAASLQNG